MINRKIWIPLILVLIAAAVFGFVWIRKRSYENARVEWKNGTVRRLAGLSITNEQILNELEMLKPHGDTNLHWGWAGEQVLRMANGEYVVYAFRHGFNNGFVPHLFLGHGSDGRWFYSSYHFCNHMVGVMSDDPPGSIAEFVTQYSVREFDGKSDECLKETWPQRE